MKKQTTPQQFRNVNQPTPTPPPKHVRKGWFISQRWRFITPLFLAVLIVAMAGAYLLARNLSGGVEVSQENLLLQSVSTVRDRTRALYDFHREEAQRVAFTIGVPEAVRDTRPEALAPLLESLAQLNGLDSLIVTDAAGLEILGLQRVELDNGVDFALSTGTELGGQAIVRDVIDSAFIGATGFLRTPSGLMLFTGVPINQGDQLIGVVLIGQTLTSVLEDLQHSAVADLSLYGPEGGLLQTTFEDTQDRDALELNQAIFSQALTAVGQVPIQTLNIGTAPYQAAYQPFAFGPNILGVVSTYMPDNIPYVTETGRQLTALLASVLAGVVVLVAFVGISRVSGRADRVSRVAGALALGQDEARTGMKPRDEVGAAGYALDQYAEFVQVRHDNLQNELKRQRREINHMTAVFESMPNGVVVQALDGRVLMMNDHARRLLGSQRVFRSSGLHEMVDKLPNVIGRSLAPGLYALGDPQRLAFGERMLRAQAAAVLSMTNQRLGTVVLLQDISDEVRLEQEREMLYQKLAEEIQQPLVNLARSGMSSNSDMVNHFAREITRQAVALQRMIVDMRELDYINADLVKHKQRPLPLETLIWAVANEWRQVALASGLKLHVIIQAKGLFVLGDEKRLRWGLGNLMDNAIKYTPTGGALTLEINAASGGLANLRIRDNGVGISEADLPHVFTRFYRGTPIKQNGEVIHVPGMGQGLHIAKQIFDAHGGAINIRSVQFKGTAAYIALPLTSGESMKLQLPRFEADMDGETVQVSEDTIFQMKRRE